MKMNPSFYNEDGLTLIELLIVMALSLLLMAAVYLTFQLQNVSGQTQQITVATQQDLRAAMETISWDIMHAGMSTSAAQAEDAVLSQGIPTNTSDEHVLRLVMTLPSGAEDIQYQLANGELQRVNMLNNTAQVLARNVTNLDFTYAGRRLVGGVEVKTDIVLAAGTKLTAAQAQTVRFITVKIQKDSDRVDPDTGNRITRALERTVCRRNGKTNYFE